MSGNVPLLKLVRQSQPAWIVESFLESGNDFMLAMKNRGVVVGEYYNANKHTMVGLKTVQLMLEKYVRLTFSLEYKVTALYADEFKERRPGAQEIRALAKRRGLIKPPAEIAPLLRYRYPQNSLGAETLLVMHEPIPDEFGVKRLVTLFEDEGRDWLGSWCALNLQELVWQGCGFVFLAEEPTIHFQLVGNEG